ncbi:MAG: YggS family pyridoxal phosphate-dependent enzyme [Gloeomargaritaceae cyanobacterium C42_A2020_066]|nr:YggS family pyridoxal phosphate-dependent enzyme [Gloeomargaritaceae cyanobacterium C42_A2020_066]
MTGRPSLAERLAQVRATLPPQVRLVAVTKQISAGVVRLAYNLGIRDFGESRLQEAQAKQAQLRDLPGITWHFIGHPQTNKTRGILTHFAWIHGVDSLALAQRLDRTAGELGLTPRVCLQVKMRPDPQKFGWEPGDLRAALPVLDTLTHLQICGLMTLPPQDLSHPEIQTVFQEAQALAAAITAQGWSRIALTELSMGMSEDYLLAIAAGATIVRLGRILFGERPAEALPNSLQSEHRAAEFLS